MRIGIKILLFIVIQLITLVGYLTAQPDSLLIEFRKIPKTADNIPKLIEISYNLIDYNVDSALICADQIRLISLPKNDYELQCKILLNLGNIAKLSGKYDESNKYLFQALEISEKNNLISSKITSLYQIGDLNRCMGLLDQSIYYLFLSRNIAHKNKVSQQYPELYEHISSTFYQLTEHTHPKFKLKKVPFQNEFNLEKSSTDVYFKLCKAYADSAVMISDLRGDNRTKLSCLNILGAYYRQQGNENRAIEYFGRAIELAEEINFRIDIPNYYINIARTYFDLKQYEKAIGIGLKAYQMAVDLNILVYKSTAANILRLSYIETKDYKNALEYQHIEASTRAEMLSQENWVKISELDRKYQTEQNQKEIEYQKNMLDLKNTEVFWKNIVIVCMLIACIVILLGILLIQKQKAVLYKRKGEIEMQSEKIKEQYERLEKLDRFKESLTHALVHDLKNPLGQIMQGSGNKFVSYPAQKMLRLIMNMLDVEKYENTEFRLNKELYSLRKILDEVKSGQDFSLMEKNLQLHLLFNDFLVLADKEVVIRVFDNLLTNAIRFSPQNRSIEVQAEKTGDNEVTIGIRNFGEPIPVEAIPYVFDKYRQFGKTDNGSSSHSTGLGLTFCKMAIEAHGQKIGTQNLEDGVLFTFTLNGNINPEQMESETKENPKGGLTHDEKVLLEPFFDRLKAIGVHEVSDILLVLNEIPSGSENIQDLKQQIIDAAFATNAELYCRIIHGG